MVVLTSEVAVDPGGYAALGRAVELADEGDRLALVLPEGAAVHLPDALPVYREEATAIAELAPPSISPVWSTPLARLYGFHERPKDA